MLNRYFKVIFIIFSCILSFVAKSNAQTNMDERHIIVSMRMIGHEILLNSSDSVSLVLPIEKEADQYKIQFESEFQFNPEEMVATIDRIVKETNIARSYLVEVENCETRQVVYSYEYGESDELDVIPCRTRMQNKGCFNILFTIMDIKQSNTSLLAVTSDLVNGTYFGTEQINYIAIIAQLFSIVFLIGLIVYFLKKKNNPINDQEVVMIGKYRLDKKNMELLFKNDKTELSSKEVDLLFLLHSSANTTLERDAILNSVWGDKGDYIGRTLDVFISKLRKKLEADSSLKILNIRGIGYKFVVNN